MSLRRVVLGSAAAVASAITIGGAVAFACITPASVSLSSASGRVGDTITVTGSSFAMPADAASGVQIRWKAPDGPLLSEVRPDAEGKFTTTINIPDGPPGYYVITAVARDRFGADLPGTPGRALFEVQTAAGPPAAVVEPQTFTPSAADSGSNFPIALAAGLGVVGLVLFAGGFVAVTRMRRGHAPTPARVRRD